MYDVIIIGSGPAGLSAAIYAARACFRTLLIEKQPMGGGQILNTADVDNYPGMPGISGFELGQKLIRHAKKLGIEQVTEEVIEIDCLGNVKKVMTNKQSYQAHALIYAAGASHKVLGVPGEKTFLGRGVSYCATCDGAFFRGKTVAVAGGGDVALEEALYLAKACSKVYLIHRRDAFRGAKSLEERVKAEEKITLLLHTIVTEICGEEKVERICLSNLMDGTEETLEADGIFIAIGLTPNTGLLEGQAEMDHNGYLLAGENCRTSVEGLYAAGDARTKALRQIVTAAADGANAVSDIEKWIRPSQGMPVLPASNTMAQ